MQQPSDDSPGHKLQAATGPETDPPIEAGDLIVEVAPNTVGTPKEFKERIAKAREAKRKSVLLLTERKKVRRFIVLPVI